MASVLRNWAITTSGDRPIHDIAADLSKAGLKNCHVLEEIGIITGAAADKAVNKLHKVRGVSTIEEEVAISVGPPDSDEPS